MKKTIAFAGGGTGGHVYPIQSLIQFINKHKEYHSKIDKIIWFGGEGSLEQKQATMLDETSPNISLEFATVVSGKIRREKSLEAVLRNFVDIFFRLPRGIIRSIMYLKSKKIDLIFCKGGHVAGPILFAARLMSVPVMVHESDTKPGIINKFAASFAKKKFTGFDRVLDGSETVGQIMSDAIYYDPEQAKKLSKEDKQLESRLKKTKKEKKTLVFVSGGAQGSRSMYSSLFKQIMENATLQDKFDFVVIMGFLNATYFKDKDIPKNVIVIDYATQQQMGMCMYYSDVALLRGGTTTLAEAKLYDMPLIIVPLPVTHDQAKNAAYYKKTYNDIVLNQNSPKYEKNLGSSLLGFTGQTKLQKTSDRYEKLQSAKKTIVDSMVETK